MDAMLCYGCYARYLVYTSMRVHDTNDVMLSTGNTMFFNHTVNDATKQLNAAKEGYTLIAILVPYDPLPKGVAPSRASVARCIHKCNMTLLGARWKTGKDTSIKYLTGMTGSTYANNVEDVNWCAVPYSCKRVRICHMDEEKRTKVFGPDFVKLTAEVVAQWSLLVPYKEQNIFSDNNLIIQKLNNFDELAQDEDSNVEVAAAVVDYGIKLISDDIFKPFEQLGGFTGVSTAVRKDSHLKFIHEAKLHVEQVVKAFLPLSNDGHAWLDHQLGDVLAKHSIENRLAAGPHIVDIIHVV